MSIYITGDCHREFERLFYPQFSGAEYVDKFDYLIVCGDFGAVWNGSCREETMLDRLERELPYTLLWIDGNHEGYERLKSYKIEPWAGGMVQFIRPHIIHLLRGYEFTIEKKRFWVMGGAKSSDTTDGIFDQDDPLRNQKIRDLKFQGRHCYRTRGVDWFPEEMPSEEEKLRGLECLKKNGMRTDYVLTHAGPTMLAQYFSAWEFEPDELTEYFDRLRTELNFKCWFCGHYHVNEAFVLENKNFEILYNRVRKIY